VPRDSSKRDKIAALISAFRASGNLDRAFDNRAAEALGVNLTDLHCLNIVENRGGVTAGALAAEAGLSTGAVTGVVERLERAAATSKAFPRPVERRDVHQRAAPSLTHTPRPRPGHSEPTEHRRRSSRGTPKRTSRATGSRLPPRTSTERLSGRSAVRTDARFTEQAAVQLAPPVSSGDP
jgi:hypothetical protein